MCCFHTKKNKIKIKKHCCQKQGFLYQVLNQYCSVISSSCKAVMKIKHNIYHQNQQSGISFAPSWHMKQVSGSVGKQVPLCYILFPASNSCHLQFFLGVTMVLGGTTTLMKDISHTGSHKQNRKSANVGNMLLLFSDQSLLIVEASSVVSKELNLRGGPIPQPQYTLILNSSVLFP